MLDLEKLLEGVDVAAEPFALCEVCGRGQLVFEPNEQPTLHFTLAGTGFCAVGSVGKISLQTNTVLVVPAGVEVSLGRPREETDVPLLTGSCRVLEPGWERVTAGTGAGRVLVACGRLQATYQRAFGLFDHLREPIIATFDDEDPIRQTVTALLSELAEPGAGSRALCRALLQQCLILLLRRCGAAEECPLPWLAALEDDRLGRVVDLVLERPAGPFSVERLAEVAGMSRSAFALRFGKAFGRGPMDFVREVRLRRAARLLVQTDRPVKSIAAQVGYGSRSQFTRAFAAYFGTGPQDYRSARDRTT